MAKKPKPVKFDSVEQARDELRAIIDRLGGDALQTIAVGLALWVRGMLGGCCEGDLSDDRSSFESRVATGIVIGRALRAECQSDDAGEPAPDDTGFAGELPTDWETAKAAFDAIVPGVEWGG